MRTEEGGAGSLSYQHSPPGTPPTPLPLPPARRRTLSATPGVAGLDLLGPRLPDSLLSGEAPLPGSLSTGTARE